MNINDYNIADLSSLNYECTFQKILNVSFIYSFRANIQIDLNIVEARQTRIESNNTTKV
jgi:hypothetical protein